jgi:hypothetical protein
MSSTPMSRQRSQDGAEPNDDTSPVPVNRLHRNSNSKGKTSLERGGHDGGVTGELHESDEGSKQEPKFVTPPRLGPSSRQESTSSGSSTSADSQESGEGSERPAPPNSATLGVRYTIHLDRLYGRHKILFTPEEDEALIRSLWHITRAGKHRSSRKWKYVALAGGDALSRRTPLALKDRYRILSVHPKLLDEYPDLQRLVVKINRMVGYAR